MFDVKKQIRQVQNYFINKIIANDFEVINVGEYELHIKIEKRVFPLWVANGLDGFRIGEGNIQYGYHFMKLDFTEEQREKAWNVIYPIVEKHITDVEMEEYATLKNKYDK